jgi:hypothetical protein
MRSLALHNLCLCTPFMYQDLLQCTIMNWDILLFFMVYSYWLMYDLLDYDLWKIETCWKCSVLIVKLHINILHLIGYNKIVKYICEQDQQDAHLISFICFSYTVLYMFRTNKFIVRRLLLYTRLIVLSMHVYDVWSVTPPDDELICSEHVEDNNTEKNRK